MAISWEDYTKLIDKDPRRKRRASQILKRAFCDLVHDRYKTVELVFDGADQISCTKCKWTRLLDAVRD